MPSFRTGTSYSRRMTRLSESILPTVCTIIMRMRHYLTVTDELNAACVAYQTKGENITDEQLHLLRTTIFTAEEYMLARSEYPSECEY